MIRIIIGTILEWIENDISEDEIKGIIASLDRQEAGKTISAAGLYLFKTNYES